MISQELLRANKLNRQIQELRRFIRAAEKVWTGRIIQERRKFIFKSASYGAIESEEYEMDTDLKNKVLDVLREELLRLEKELQDI